MRIDKTSAAFTTFARPVPFYFLEVRTNGKAPNFSTELGSLWSLKLKIRILEYSRLEYVIVTQ